MFGHACRRTTSHIGREAAGGRMAVGMFDESFEVQHSLYKGARRLRQ